MGKLVENTNVRPDVDENGVWVTQVGYSSHEDLDDSEIADLRSQCSTQTTFDNWWANQGGARAAWYGAFPTARKTRMRAAVMRLKP